MSDRSDFSRSAGLGIEPAFALRAFASQREVRLVSDDSDCLGSGGFFAALLTTARYEEST